MRFSISRGFLIDRKCLFYIVLAIEEIEYFVKIGWNREVLYA